MNSREHHAIPPENGRDCHTELPIIASTIARAREGFDPLDGRNRVRGAKGRREFRELGDRNGSFVGVRRHRREEGIVNLPGGRRAAGTDRPAAARWARVNFPDPASPAARDLRGCTLPFARRFSLRRRLHPRENAAALAARRGEMRNGSGGACARRTGRAGRGSARPNRGAAHFPYACNPLSGDPRGSALMQPWDLRRYPAMLARVSQGKGDRVWPRSHAERPPLHALAGTRGRNRASRGTAPVR